MAFEFQKRKAWRPLGITFMSLTKCLETETQEPFPSSQLRSKFLGLGGQVEGRVMMMWVSREMRRDQSSGPVLSGGGSVDWGQASENVSPYPAWHGKGRDGMVT